jgi:hypothetical protein
MQEHIEKLKAISTADPSIWKDVVAAALQVVSAEILCQELSCSTSTIERWKAGRDAPGPSARLAIRDRLVELMETAASTAA